MASLQQTTSSQGLFLNILLIAITLPVASCLTPTSFPGTHHPNAHSGLDNFQKGMIIGFVTFAVLALFMMILILYFLVKGTRRELKKAQVELAELREQRRQDVASERLQVRSRTSELQCIVDEDEDDSSDLVKDEKDQYEDEFDCVAPPSPSYDNYTYVNMKRNGRHGRKPKQANDFIIEN
ncbi:uncharacterized protein LOC117299677 [Asterias rubens]|uniref:uncharacterized protein LOC117299677 n=1 Tax=Asterias rubens TaxID=7604 RepID=UPI00145560E7|nr:uncharacterized protein LOC117299677 [Asterias rubens]